MCYILNVTEFIRENVLHFKCNTFFSFTGKFSTVGRTFEGEEGVLVKGGL